MNKTFLRHVGFYASHGDALRRCATPREDIRCLCAGMVSSLPPSRLPPRRRPPRPSAALAPFPVNQLRCAPCAPPRCRTSCAPRPPALAPPPSRPPSSPLPAAATLRFARHATPERRKRGGAASSRRGGPVGAPSASAPASHDPSSCTKSPFVPPPMACSSRLHRGHSHTICNLHMSRA